ncbi:MAG: SHD1 domain-containing protein, partial [Planctomycetota bacterium]
IKAPAGYVRYKLSNVRAESNVLGEVIAIDYKRTSGGTGSRQVQLAVRTDSGRLGILGMSTIDESGTIRLRDQFAGLSRVLGNGNQGMEFFFVVDSSGIGGSYYSPITSSLMGGKEYLVSNVVSRGTMNSKVSARDLTAKEKEAFEAARKASLPPEGLPPGYIRGTALTELAVGAPIMAGQGGKWVPAIVVELPKAGYVKVKLENSNYLRTLMRQNWIAVSNEIAAKIKKDPDQFSCDIRTLPGGNMVLEDGLEPLTDAMSLFEGTPVVKEFGSRWQDVHFLSSDNVSARVLVNQFNKYKVELVPKEKLAIRTQTLADLKKENAKEMFAANVEGYDSQVAGLAKFPGDVAGGSGLSGNRLGGNSGLAGSTGLGGSMATEAAPEPKTAPMRTWSDSTGKFQVEAQLVEKTEQSVTLKRANGKIASVPLNKLSAQDLAYLEELDAEAENPFSDLMGDDSSSPAASSGVAAGTSNTAWNYVAPLETVSKVTDMRGVPKSVAISPTKTNLVIGRSGSEVAICDAATGRILMNSGRMDHMGDVTVAKFTPDSKYLVIGGYKGAIEVYEATTNGKLNLKAQFAAHTKEIGAIAFSADGKYALTGGADKVANYWEVATGKKIAAIDGFDGKVKATCIRPSDGMLLACDGKFLKVFDPASNQEKRTVEVGRSAYCQAVAISPNGAVLALNETYAFNLWNLVNFRQMPAMEGNDLPWICTFAPDSRHLISGHNGVVNIWDTKSQSRINSCKVGQYFNVQALGISHDGSTIASSSAHGEVTVLRAKPAE